MEADHLQSLVIFLQNSPSSSSSSPSWQFGVWSQWSRTAPRQPSAPHRDATVCCCLVTVSTSACIHICICISMCTLCLFLPAWYNIVLSCLDTMRYKEITVSPLKPKTVYNCIIWKIANNSLGTECLQKQEPAILLSHTGRLNEVNSKFRFASSANHQKDQEGQHFVCLAIFQINQPKRSLFSKSSKTNQQGQSFVIWKWSKTN